MTHIHTKSLWLLIATLLLSVFGARAQDSGSDATWTVNPHDYKYDMTLYANIVFDGTPITDFSHYQVGAFVGDECRGTAEVQTKDEAQWLYLRVRSNKPQGENIVLRLRDTDTGEVLNLQPESGDITFESQGLGGRPGSPLVLTAAHWCTKLMARSTTPRRCHTAQRSPPSNIPNARATLSAAGQDCRSPCRRTMWR